MQRKNLQVGLRKWAFSWLLLWGFYLAVGSLLEWHPFRDASSRNGRRGGKSASYHHKTLSVRFFTPISVKAGIPLNGLFVRKQVVLMVVTMLWLSRTSKLKRIDPGGQYYRVHPQEKRCFSYSCWMGMIYSKITVTD